MAIYRVQKNQNYTTISNYHLRDMSLSLKAKGLLSLILSLPEDWNYSVKGLASIVKEGEETIESTLKELKSFGYIEVTKTRNEKTGLFEYVYDIYESPQKEEYPGGYFPPVASPVVDDTPLILNKEEQSKEKQNTESIKEKNTKKEKLRKLSALQALPMIQEEFNLTDEVIEALKEFIEIRKAKKSPLTGYSLRLLVFDLIRLSEDPEKQVRIINQSVVNAWKGFFMLKEERPAEITHYQRAPEPKEEEDVIEKLRKKYKAMEEAEKQESGLLSEE